MNQHDKSGRTQSQPKNNAKRIGTTVLIAAASLLGTTLGVKATTQEEPAASPAQGLAGQNAGSGGHTTLVAETMKVTTPTPPQVSHKVTGSSQIKINTQGSNQLKYQSNQIKGGASNQIKLQGSQQNKQ